jgi:hypothetical protein
VYLKNFEPEVSSGFQQENRSATHGLSRKKREKWPQSFKGITRKVRGHRPSEVMEKREHRSQGSERGGSGRVY